MSNFSKVTEYFFVQKLSANLILAAQVFSMRRRTQRSPSATTTWKPSQERYLWGYGYDAGLGKFILFIYLFIIIIYYNYYYYYYLFIIYYLLLLLLLYIGNTSVLRLLKSGTWSHFWLSKMGRTFDVVQLHL